MFYFDFAHLFVLGFVSFCLSVGWLGLGFKLGLHMCWATLPQSSIPSPSSAILLHWQKAQQNSRGQTWHHFYPWLPNLYSPFFCGWTLDFLFSPSFTNGTVHIVGLVSLLHIPEWSGINPQDGRVRTFPSHPPERLHRKTPLSSNPIHLRKRSQWATARNTRWNKRSCF